MPKAIHAQYAVSVTGDLLEQLTGLDLDTAELVKRLNREVRRGALGIDRFLLIQNCKDSAGHAATAAPARPWPRPCATLAASVAAMPRQSSQRGNRRLAARGVKHHHRTRADQAVHRQRDQASSPASLTVRPHQMSNA